MKILITGGCGYVGGFLTDLLTNNNYDVTVYDNLTYERYFLKPVKFINGDVRDYEKLAKIIPDYDVIIALAAIVGDGACAVDLNLTTSVNFESIKWLVDNFGQTKKIIFPSTCSVYGINHELIDENATPNPLSAYAQTKLQAEQYIIAHAKDYLVFRLGTLFGLGDYFSRIRFDLVANILTLKATCKEDLSVFGGEQWRPLLHVKDVSTAILYSLQNNITGLYNLSYKNYTIKELAEEIQKLVPDTIVKAQDMKFEDLRNYRVSTDKFLATGWTPKLTLEHGIAEINAVVATGRIADIKDPVYSNVDYLKKNFKKN